MLAFDSGWGGREEGSEGLFYGGNGGVEGFVLGRECGDCRGLLGELLCELL